MAGQRPGGLLAVAIIALVLGVLGGCGGLWGIGGLLLQDQLLGQQRELYEGAGVNLDEEEALGRQLELQEQLAAPSRQWRPALLTHQAFNVVTSGILLAAGILLLLLKPPAPALFMGAALGNLVVDLGGAIVGVLVQLETQRALADLSGQLSPDGAAAADVGAVMEGVLQASTGAALCFAIGWLLVKTGFYIAGTLYLRRTGTRQLFGSTQAA